MERDFAWERALGQENPHDCTKPGDWQRSSSCQGGPGRWAELGALVADCTPDPSPPFLAHLFQGTGSIWDGVLSSGGTANADPWQPRPSPASLQKLDTLPRARGDFSHSLVVTAWPGGT